MRLFMATLSTETNTFSPMPTGLSGFEDFYLRHGTATQDPPNLMTEALHLWRAKAEALGWEVVESLAAIAEPAGLTVAGTYDRLKAEILEDLTAAAGPISSCCNCMAPWWPNMWRIAKEISAGPSRPLPGRDHWRGPRSALPSDRADACRERSDDLLQGIPA